MAEKSTLEWVVWVLVVVGALNWGLVGALNLNVVELVVGALPWLARLVYVLVGLAGLWMLYGLVKKK